MNRKIDPFLVRGLVGRGGSGHRVLREEHDTRPRLCFKAFLSRSAGPCSSDFCDHRVGVHALASLQHPNIVRIHDFANFQIGDVDCLCLNVVLDLDSCCTNPPTRAGDSVGGRQIGTDLAIGLFGKPTLPFIVRQVLSEAGAGLVSQIARTPEPKRSGMFVVSG